MSSAAAGDATANTAHATNARAVQRSLSRMIVDRPFCPDWLLSPVKPFTCQLRPLFLTSRLPTRELGPESRQVPAATGVDIAWRWAPWGRHLEGRVWFGRVAVGFHDPIAKSRPAVQGGNGSSGEVEDDGEEASDETPPTLGLISIEGATVNMSEESRVITITVEAADDMSGIFELCLTWRPEQGPGALDVGKGSCGQGLLDLVAGSPTEGRWQGLLEVPPDFPAQTWSFAGWRLVDGAGNEATGNDGVPDIVLVE